MANKIFSLLVCIFIGIIFIGCNNNRDNNNNDFYSVRIRSFNNLDSAEVLKNKLEKLIKDTLFISESLTKKGIQLYSVCFGNYTQNFDAGQKANELYQDSLIENYQIVKGDSVVTDIFGKILFLGYNNNKVSLFSFNILNKVYTLLWTNPQKNIISLNADERYQNIYFITADKIPDIKGYPILKNIVINKYNLNNKKTNPVDRIRTLFQVFSNIGEDNVLRVSYLNFDSTNMAKINKTTNYYSSEGVKVESKYETFDVLKDGVPNLGTVLLKVKSNTGKHFIDFTRINGQTKLFYKNLETKVKEYITSSDFSVAKIDWDIKDNYCVIYLEKYDEQTIESKISSLLILYEIKTKEIKQIIENPTTIDFIIRGNYLIYEQNTNTIKKIVFYDMKKNDTFHIIEAKKDCALKTLNIN
ncbi:MAG: hypothetical protein V1773_16445 [bacterium]